MDITMTRRGLNRATLDRPLLLGRSPQHPVEAIEHLVGLQAQAVERTALRRPAADLAARFPDLDAAALAYACRCRLPLVQAPPRGVWGKASRLALAPLDGWLGRPPSAAPSLDDVVLRHLGAFGPATAADVATWSRLTGIREVLDRLRPRLLAVRDPAGRQLLDLPEALCPHPDTPAPVRFLPEYDNVVLSHSDRARLRSDDHERLAGAAGPIKGSVLVDGRVGAIWHAEAGRDRRYVSLVVEHLRLDQRETQALEAEAERVVHFFHPDAGNPHVRLVASS